jgi:predicted methyltransferase
MKRVNLLKDRYPFCEYLKIGIIGDDDFLSAHIVNDEWIWPVIVELDDRIISKISSLSARYEIVHSNISKLVFNAKKLNSYQIQTFISDPPYTFDGVLSFMLTGLKMMKFDDQEKEFYLIINRAMMGGNLDKLMKVTSDAGIFVKDIIPNFSRYKLPEKFDERRRASEFLISLGVDPKILLYSSSSSLYIFKTNKPEPGIIERVINVSKIYDHY